MLNKTQQKQLERDIGPLASLPSDIRQGLEKAFLIALAIRKKQEEVEAKYSTYAGTEDTPDRKMKRYRKEKAAHYGLLPGIVCSCFREDTSATPCSYVPDKVVGWSRSYYAQHGVWWKL